MTHEQVAASERDDHTELDRLVRGVGQVCIAASGLEAQLAFLCLTLDGWTDDKFRDALSRTGQALREYEQLVPRLDVFGLGADPRKLLDQARELLCQRNRVVHSVMMIDVKGGERNYEAWHAKADETWDADPPALRGLAEELAQLTAEADAFAQAWTERAERDGWPLLPSSSRTTGQ